MESYDAHLCFERLGRGPSMICSLAWDHLDGLADDEEGAHAHQDDAQPVLLLLPAAVRAAPAAAERRGEQRRRRSLSAEIRPGRDGIAISSLPARAHIWMCAEGPELLSSLLFSPLPGSF